MSETDKANNTTHRAGMADGEDWADPNETASAEIAESLATESNLPETNSDSAGPAPETGAKTDTDEEPDPGR